MHKQRCINNWFMYCTGRPMQEKGARKREVHGGHDVLLYVDYPTGACQHDWRTCSSCIGFNAELSPMTPHLEAMEEAHQAAAAAGKPKPAT